MLPERPKGWLPGGFVRIRYYGFLANRYRRERLELCRNLLDVRFDAQPIESPAQASEDTEPPTKHETCPACLRGRLVIIDDIPAIRPPRRPIFLRRPAVASRDVLRSSRAPRPMTTCQIIRLCHTTLRNRCAPTRLHFDLSPFPVDILRTLIDFHTVRTHRDATQFRRRAPRSTESTTSIVS